MALFKEGKIESAYLKMGIYGGNGSGKTFTASLVSIGLHKHIKAKKPIYFLDSETGSDYVIPLFEQHKIKLHVCKTRSFADLLVAVDEAEKNASILIADSITHFWDDLVESFKKKKNLSRISLQNWGVIKPIWRDFSTKYVTSNLHIIVCGRAGDVWDEVEDEEGVKELRRTGTRMRVEKELGYEPSLLVEMEKARLSNRKGAGWVHRAWVVKDRFNVVDSQHFDDPAFESFLPYVDLLNLGGTHKAIEQTQSSQELFDDRDNGYERQRRAKILLEKIREELYVLFPRQSSEDKTSRSNLLKEIFDTRSWTEVEGKKLQELEIGLELLMVKSEKKPEEKED